MASDGKSPAPVPFKPNKKKQNQTAKEEIRPTAAPARTRRRHVLVLLSFALLVGLPGLLAASYLWMRAADQYASQLTFTVRQEDATSAVDILGGLTSLSKSGASDADVLYEFIQSQELVRKVDEELDLREIYSANHETDPIFAFDPAGSIEDLVRYWKRMVQVSYDTNTGLIELRVLAFDAEDAHRIAERIFEESSNIINELSAIAREDAMRYAREDLDQAVERLKVAREALTTFRSRNQIVDPNADIQSQMGLLTTLQQQLASALIEMDLLVETTRDNDPRIAQASRRIEVIRERIREERAKFGTSGLEEDAGDYASLVSEFERLTVDREFAERTYTAALSAFDAAQAEANRQSRYLASFVGPTLAERSEFPRRYILMGLIVLFLAMAWAILVLIVYSLRDRQ